LVNTLQMVGQKLISRRSARKILGVRSIVEEEAQIRAERLEDAMLESARKGPANPQAERQGLQRGAIPRGQLPPPEQLAGALSALGGAGELGPSTPPPPPGPGPAPTSLVDEQSVKRALGRAKYSGRVYLLSVGSEGIRVAVTNEGDRAKVERALEDIGAPVNVEVVSERPTEGTRIRGSR
ncbi:MAG: hypothetical protein ACREQA_06215, partial [Candidatus Binatia bacterium]